MTGPDKRNSSFGDAWAVTVHGRPGGRHGRGTDDRALGSGVLIDRSRVLTSLSVAGAGGLWVTFPQAGGVVRHPVRQVRADGGLAVLELVSPAPREARAAPLRRAEPGDLIGERWQLPGGRAYGVIAGPLPAGRMRLDLEPPAHLPPESTGAGVWSVRLGAVVAVLEPDAEAHTLERLGRDLPEPIEPEPDEVDLGPAPTGRHAREPASEPDEPPDTSPGPNDTAGRPVRVASEAGPAGRNWSLEVGAEPGRLWRPGTDGGLVESDPWQPARRPPGKASNQRRTAAPARAERRPAAGDETPAYQTAWIAGARRPERVPSAGGAVTALCPVTLGDNLLVASAAADGTVALADPATGQARHTLTTEPGQVRALAPLRLPDATCLGIVSADGSLTAWAAEQGWGQTFTAHSRRATTATGAEAGLLAVGGEDGTVEVRALGDPRPRWTATAGDGPVAALCALPGLLAAAGDDGRIRLRDTETGALRRTLETGDGAVSALCPVPIGDRTLLAAAGEDGAVRFWDPYTGELRRTMAGHTAAVTALCPVPAGRTASVSADRTARLWDPVTGACELTIPLHHEATACVAAGNHLIVGLTAGTVAYRLRR